MTASADPAVTGCPDQLPDWVSRLRADLDRMARELTARLLPWHGPKRVLMPEDFGLGGDRHSVVDGGTDPRATELETVR